MLSEEEKKAIDYFRNKIGDFELFYGKKITTQENEYLKIFLNLIEKQSKEIEELKEVKWYYEISRVPKDKIKAKIEEVKDGTYDAKIILQSLLEKE